MHQVWQQWQLPRATTNHRVSIGFGIMGALQQLTEGTCTRQPSQQAEFVKKDANAKISIVQKFI
jgi:hypothetical protein